MKSVVIICSLIVIAFFRLVIPSICLAEDITITATRDTTIFSSPTNFSNGSGDYFFAGKVEDAGEGTLRRALVFFDIAGHIPAGSTILSATLTVNLSRTPDENVEHTVSLHPILADWGEGNSHASDNEGMGTMAGSGDATWTHSFFSTMEWTKSGGDFSESASASRRFGIKRSYSWNSTPAMVADVQGWLDNRDNNFGWLLKGDESETGSAKRFDSKDNNEGGQKPTLTVEFLLPICSITRFEVGDRTLCSTDTNTYNQKIQVTYNEEPKTGFLVINNQQFPIKNSPQMVELKGLQANGENVNVTARFSDSPSCSRTEMALFTAPNSCECNIETITLGTKSICNPKSNTYSQKLRVIYENPPESGTLDINDQSYPIERSPQTITLENLIADGLGVDVIAQFSENTACSFTASDFFTAREPCSSCEITHIRVDAQSECNPTTNTYLQALTLQYKGEPTSGTLDINGHSFPIDGSPQTITLENLLANGVDVDVTAVFSDRPGCALTQESLFTAPDPCPLCEIIDVVAIGQPTCQLATNTYSQDVSVSFETRQSTRDLNINGRLYQLETSSRTITLNELTADGSHVDVTAWFSDLNILNDDFQAGSTAGWEGNGASPPMIINDGGPTGDDDRFLQVSSLGGEGSGSRLAVFNASQWTGDFTAMGITAIAMEVNNIGMTTLQIRLLLRANEGEFASRKSGILKSGSGWRTLVFPIESNDWFQLSGETSIEQALSNVTQFRIFHNPETSFPGPDIVATLGIDNITGVCALTRRDVFSAPDCTPILSLSSGWNLISLPVRPSTPTIDTIFANNNDNSESLLTSPVWTWKNGRFESVRELKALTGYWVHINGPETIRVEGAEPKDSDGGIQAGWNLVGPPNDNFILPQNGVVNDHAWGFDGLKFQTETILRVMKGYWLYSSGPTSLNSPE